MAGTIPCIRFLNCPHPLSYGEAMDVPFAEGVEGNIGDAEPGSRCQRALQLPNRRFVNGPHQIDTDGVCLFLGVGDVS